VKGQAALGSISKSNAGFSPGTAELDLSKHEILDALQGLSLIAREYGAMLENLSQGAEPAEEAWKRLLNLGQQLKSGRLAFSRMRLIMALTRHVIARWNGDQLRFQIPSVIGELGDRDNSELSEYSNSLKQHLKPSQQLVSEVRAMSRALDLEGREYLAGLLGDISSLFKALVRQDWEDVELVHSHINLSTSAHDRHELVRHVARIARGIYDSLRTFSEELPLESLSQQSQGLPDAVGKLRAVIAQLEQAANANLDALERLSRENRENLHWVQDALRAASEGASELDRLIESHPAAAEGLERARLPLTGKLIPELRDLADSLQRRQEGLLSLISNQGFQDLSGQTLGKVINHIEALQFQLIDVLKRHSDGLAGTPSVPESGPSSSEPAASGVQNQEQVDRLLTELGF